MGAKKPQTGQVARMAKRNAKIPKAVIVGMTAGQYTSQADESVKPLNFGKYTVKYAMRMVLIPNKTATTCNRDKFAPASTG